MSLVKNEPDVMSGRSIDARHALALYVTNIARRVIVRETQSDPARAH